MSQPEENAPPPNPPEWLTRACNELGDRYKDDSFEITLKPQDPTLPHEWRMRCHDCPERLFITGPEQALRNFEVHLNNRLHRGRVSLRRTVG